MLIETLREAVEWMIMLVKLFENCEKFVLREMYVEKITLFS